MAIEEVYAHPEDYDLETSGQDIGDEPFWLDLVRRERPRRVLEIGCGTGRLTLPLARAGARLGFVVTALDPAGAMLARARQRADREADQVRAHLRFVDGEIHDVAPDEPFDLALMPYGAAHHLTDHDARIATWRAVRRRLVPGGLFVVDLVAPDLRLLAAALDGTARRKDLDVRGADGRHLRRSAYCLMEECNPKRGACLTSNLTVLACSGPGVGRRGRPCVRQRTRLTTCL